MCCGVSATLWPKFFGHSIITSVSTFWFYVPEFGHIEILRLPYVPELGHIKPSKDNSALCFKKFSDFKKFYFAAFCSK